MPLPPPGRFDGAALRLTRETAALSRPQLAERVGVDVALIKSWETRGVCPTVGNITRVAQALGLKVSDLYTPDAASAGALRDLRVAAGITQQELAHHLGVRQGLISMWERGKARPTWDEIARYATTLDVDPTVIGAAIDLTESRCGSPKLRQRPVMSGDFQLSESAPHVIYEFTDPAGHATVTSPQFPELRFSGKFATPSMLEIATLNAHVGASYCNRHNHFQWRCSAGEPGQPTYLIRWLDPAHERTEDHRSARPRVVDSLIASTTRWRSGEQPGPKAPLSTGEYLVIVVEPTDTIRFITEQIVPGEPVTLIPTRLDETLRDIVICFGPGPTGTTWLGALAPAETPPDMTYAELVQLLQSQGVERIDVTPAETARADTAAESHRRRYSRTITPDEVQQEAIAASAL